MLPARFHVNRRAYTLDRRIERTLHRLSETKLIALNPHNEATPVPIQVGANANQKSFVLGSDLPASWADCALLGGITLAPGTGSNQRIGSDVYLKHTTLSVSIDMPVNTVQRPPMEFRVLMFKQRRAVIPTGTAPTPQATLFLNAAGAPTGHAVAGFTGVDCMIALPNSREWIIYKDFKFTLSKPMYTDGDGGAVGYSGHYPTSKTFRLQMPHYKKTRYEGNNLPDDYDYRFGLIIYSRCMSNDQAAAAWEVTTRGTTSFTDN